MIRSLITLALLIPCTAQAQAVADTTVNYGMYVLGVRMALGEVHLAYDPSGYRIDLRMRTTGAAKMFYDGFQDSAVSGTWQSGGPLPAVLNSTGTWNGDPHKLVISFATGAPVVTTLIPPDRKKREPIPPEKLRDAIDIPSAIVALLRQVATAGSCERSSRTFDGRRLSQVSAHDAGDEVLKPDERSSFSGPTKRCRLDIRQISGFEKGDDPVDATRTRHATVWLARVTPDGPMVPVRIDMEARYVGEAQLFLSRAEKPPG
jgi:hypothetical protein